MVMEKTHFLWLVTLISPVERYIHILRKHFYSTKLNLTSKFFTKTVFFFRQNKKSFPSISDYFHISIIFDYLDFHCNFEVLQLGQLFFHENIFKLVASDSHDTNLDPLNKSLLATTVYSIDYI